MGGKTNRKFGRNAKRGQAARYANEGRREKNKTARMARTAKRQPNNEQIRLTVDQRREFDRQNATVNAERRTADKRNWAGRFRQRYLTAFDRNFHRTVDALPGKLDVRSLWGAVKEKEVKA